jgi:hypothetical protein
MLKHWISQDMFLANASRRILSWRTTGSKQARASPTMKANAWNLGEFSFDLFRAVYDGVKPKRRHMFPDRVNVDPHASAAQDCAWPYFRS